MTVSIVGTGYVGLTTGAVLAAAGNKVYCIDVDAKKIETIQSGKSHFYEPGLDKLIAEGIKSKKLIPTTRYRNAIPYSDIAIICVGTPSKGDGSVDLSYIYSAGISIHQYMKDELVIAQKSTVPVGTGRKLERILRNGNKSKKFNVVSCPEFLAEGSAVFDTLNMDRIVVGGDSEKAKQKMITLLESIDKFSSKINTKELTKYSTVYKNKVIYHNKTPFKDRVISVGLESAELIKVTANAFLTTKISFANSIARICDQTGADILEVMEGVGRDERIGKAFLYAGLGWGGGCFPKDTAGLIYHADEVGFDFKILKAVVDLNNSQVLYVIRKVHKILGADLEGKKISVLGLSFKPGTSDVRISPSIRLVNNLIRKGAKVTVYDPKALQEAKADIDGSVHYANNVDEAVKGSELAILATDWPELVDIDFKKLKKIFKRPNLLDARNKWDKEQAIKFGYKYFGIGR
ncbi:MAG: UDP-glucose/GDP-mannose dehydrogenase family protein [Candidatus Dojkabacteria bacterium]|nr:UDP-glucose/GDP-mannose dehydrogenase family protein [Candidatus Dojkabacteria bacterium]